MISVVVAILAIQTPNPSIPNHLSEFGDLMGDVVQCQAFDYDMHYDAAEAHVGTIIGNSPFWTLPMAKGAVTRRMEYEANEAVKALDAITTRADYRASVEATVARCDTLAVEHPHLLTRGDRVDAGIAAALAHGDERYPD